MKSNSAHCKVHGKLLEYVCTHCRSLICPKCLFTHPKHDTLFGDSNSMMHLLKYAKTTLRTNYWNSITHLKENIPLFRPLLGSARKSIKEVLAIVIPTVSSIKSLITAFESLRDDLSAILTKVEYAAYSDSEVKAVEGELERLGQVLNTFNLFELIKMVESENTAMSRPRLEKEDLEAVERVYEIYKTCSIEEWKKLISQIQELGRNISKMAGEVKVAGKTLNKPLVFKENVVEQKSSFEKLLQGAITGCEIDKAYELFNKAQRLGKSDKELTNLCLTTNNGLPVLFSYATQDTKKESLLNHLAEINNEMNQKKDARFKSLNMEKTIEYMKVKKILSKTLLQEQKTNINNFIRSAPKKIYDFSNLALAQYLESKNFQIDLARILKAKKPEWEKVFLKIEGFLQVVYDASQIPCLEFDLEEINKRSNVPKDHIAITRLCGYARAKDWKKFSTFINNNKPKQRPKFFADLCISYDNKELAVEYIKKIPDCRTQIDFFVEIESYQNAADIAVLSKKPEVIDYLKSKSPYIDYFIRVAKVNFEKPSH